MKASISQESILAGLAKACAVIPTKSGAVSLRTVWIEVSGNLMTISSTDSFVEFTGTYPCEGSEDGRIGVQGSILLAVIKNCEGTIEISQTGTEPVVIRHKSGSLKLARSADSWYEKNRPCPESGGIEWNAEMLKDVIERTRYAIGTDDDTSPLVCFRIWNYENNPAFCALNGHLFTMCTAKHEEFAKQLEKKDVLIHNMYLQQITKFIGTDVIGIYLAEKSVFFKKENEILCVPRVSVYEEAYPDCTAILEKVKENMDSVICNRMQLVLAMNRIDTISDEIDQSATLLFDAEKKCISCSARDEKNGEISESIAMEFSGTIKSVTIRTSDLITILKHFGSEKIELRLNTNTSPILFVGTEECDKDYTVLCMPIMQMEMNYTEEVTEEISQEISAE